jgi:hypothetical protein
MRKGFAANTILISLNDPNERASLTLLKRIQ